MTIWSSILHDPPVSLVGMPPAALAIGSSLVGSHCGLYFLNEEGQALLLHMAFHLLLEKDEVGGEVASRMGWLQSSIPAERLDVLAALCGFVLDREVDRPVPYGFRFESSEVESDGWLVVAYGESGFTCATFVIALCERAMIDLLDRPTWSDADESRRAEDSEKQQLLVNYLESHSRADYRLHAPRLQQEVGAPRFRSEEVVAAIGRSGGPFGYAQASIWGGELLREGQGRTWW